jgi:competence protein ComEA
MRHVIPLLLCILLAIPAAAGEPIDINTADADMLSTLKGIGRKRAEAIVADREKNGPFQSIDDLTRVQGVGDKLVEANRSLISVGEPAPR